MIRNSLYTRYVWQNGHYIPLEVAVTITANQYHQPHTAVNGGNQNEKQAPAQLTQSNT